ncbi:MAG: hypothetical protein A3I77_04655 [Gammaproteobacteria bacterium RIFCSPLOWO2_02_FULL_42_14]|nr:MAG: hypothetical protein A3B71_05955 [Gammaproteobacteria bacterium RIFCSPHIGHO2_02_FULL_42_43]OGT51529.1 MAG: hypothetical protein A3E54_05720 [Gammaproteobacteria bacterium RIFCSPHIGHO2_12_FULL_41_25]OGT62229.1 MAG: hypothetical protein A3I77_04655 [Gammaproteobacteria bacterium RIFCSPLOWO2_02_FULL_42_14]OGT85903.1 MAG: hypothetical protein A3G86_04345 [Gammaproteobacteria bacterium RIFCSPLOWO2_12_FULL_42_18]
MRNKLQATYSGSLKDINFNTLYDNCAMTFNDPETFNDPDFSADEFIKHFTLSENDAFGLNEIRNQQIQRRRNNFEKSTVTITQNKILFSLKRIGLNSNSNSNISISSADLLAAYNADQTKNAQAREELNELTVKIFLDEKFLKRFLFGQAFKKFKLTAEEITPLFKSLSPEECLKKLATLDFSKMTITRVSGGPVENFFAEPLIRNKKFVQKFKPMLIEASHVAKKLQKNGATGLDENGRAIIDGNVFIQKVNQGRRTFTGAYITGDIDFSKINKDIFKLHLENATFSGQLTFPIDLASKRGKPRGRLKGNVIFEKPVHYIFDKLTTVIVDFSETITDDKAFVLNEKNAANFIRQFRSSYKTQKNKRWWIVGNVLTRKEYVALKTDLEKAQFLLQRAYSQQWTRTAHAALVAVSQCKLETEKNAPLHMSDGPVEQSDLSGSSSELETISLESPRVKTQEEITQEIDNAKIILAAAFGNAFEESAFCGTGLDSKEARDAAKEPIVAAAKLLMMRNDPSVTQFISQLKNIESRLIERVLHRREYKGKHVRYALLESLQVALSVNTNAIKLGEERRKVPNQDFFKTSNNVYVIAQQKIWASRSLGELKDAGCKIDEVIFGLVQEALAALKKQPENRIAAEKLIYIAKLLATEQFDFAIAEAKAYAAVNQNREIHHPIQAVFDNAIIALINSAKKDLNPGQTVAEQLATFKFNSEARKEDFKELIKYLPSVTAFSTYTETTAAIARGIAVTDVLKKIVFAACNATKEKHQPLEVDHLISLAKEVDFNKNRLRQFVWTDSNKSLLTGFLGDAIASSHNRDHRNLCNSLKNLLCGLSTVNDVGSPEAKGSLSTLDPAELKIITSSLFFADQAVTSMRNALAHVWAYTKFEGLLEVSSGAHKIEFKLEGATGKVLKKLQFAQKLFQHLNEMTERRDTQWFLFKEESELLGSRDGRQVMKSYARIVKEFDVLIWFLKEVDDQIVTKGDFTHSLQLAANALIAAKQAWMDSVASVVTVPELKNEAMEQLLQETEADGTVKNDSVVTAMVATSAAALGKTADYVQASWKTTVDYTCWLASLGTSGLSVAASVATTAVKTTFGWLGFGGAPAPQNSTRHSTSGLIK